MAKLSTLRKELQEGCFASFHTQVWHCKIYLASAIDKVKFSFYKTKENSAVEGGFDIYMDVSKFAVWVKDIENLRILTILKSEADAGQQYPKTYSYVTGESGEKTVGFCSSKATGCIALNGKVGAGSLEHCIIPIPVLDIRAAAMVFTISTRKYFDELEELIRAGIENNAKFFEEKTEKPVENKGAVQLYTLKTTSALEQFVINGEVNSPCFKCGARTSSGESVEIQFLNGFIKKSTELFNAFAEYMATHPIGTPLKIMAKPYEYNGAVKLQFQNFVREVR